MPGFANTHTHFTLTLARGIYEDLSPPHNPPFTGGLAYLPTPELSDGEAQVMARLGALEAIRSGTTLAFENALGVHRYADALVESGLRFLLGDLAWDRANASIGQPGPFEIDPALAEPDCSEPRTVTPAGTGRGTVVSTSAWLRGRRTCAPRICFAACATCRIASPPWPRSTSTRSGARWPPSGTSGASSPPSTSRVRVPRRAAGRGTLPVHDVRGGDPARPAGAAVAFNSAIAARRGLSPRIAELEAAGCRITMGTDNMAEDMLEVARTGLFMERVRRQDGRRPTPEEVLLWATRNGYRALGVPDGGWLAPGNRADLILVDLRRPHLTPALRVVSCLLHQGQAGDVEAVMVDGRWLMRDGRVLTIDEPAVVAEAERVARSAWRRLFEARSDLVRPPGLHLGA